MLYRAGTNKGVFEPDGLDVQDTGAKYEGKEAEFSVGSYAFVIPLRGIAPVIQ